MSKGMITMSEHSFKHDRDAKQCDTANTVVLRGRAAVLLCGWTAVFRV